MLEQIGGDRRVEQQWTHRRLRRQARNELRIRSDFQQSLVRRQAQPGFLSGMFASRQE